ncbi:MAG: 5-formyltetrahydrofolate cyclo-ligase [Bacteroidetes bacterium]|jgi:5-formyltetrahydrofolate cyclo-ligase|nr:5-formyltetrahydrofolate cyclo-ligase [Bacteroidota bacterium]
MAEDATKAALRQRFRDVRAKLTRAAQARHSSAIVAHALALPVVASADTVHCYWPLLDQGEVDTRPLIRALLDRGVRVVLPVVRRFDTTRSSAPRMMHRVLDGRAALHPNRWRVWEPLAGAEVTPADLDVIIAPALGADRRGYRVGYGMGYYDELLHASPACSVCLLYTDTLVPRLPAEAHDAPVDVLVTQHGTPRAPQAANDLQVIN